MSVGRSLIRNIGLLLGGKAVAGLLSIVYIVIVTRELGPTDFGVLILVNTWVLAVAGIVAFSGWHAIVRYGAQALESGDMPRFMRLARFMTLVELGCGLLAMLVAFLLAPLAARTLGWPPEMLPLAQLYSVVVFANVLTTPHGILQLGERFDKLAIHPALQPLVRLVGVLAVWLSEGGLSEYLIVWMVSAVSESIFMWILAWPVFERMRGKEPRRGGMHGVARENEALLRFLVTTNADLKLRDLAPRLVPLIIGASLGPAAAGIYSLAQRAAVILQQPAIQLSQAGFPVIAKMLAGGDREAAIRLTWRTCGIALAVTVPVIILLAFFSRQILQLLGGSAFGGGAFLFILLTIGRAAQLGAVPLSSALIALGRTGASIAVNLGTNLGLLPLLPILLSLYGIDGAGWHGLILGVAALIALALVFRTSARAPGALSSPDKGAAPTDERQGLTDG